MYFYCGWEIYFQEYLLKTEYLSSCHNADIHVGHIRHESKRMNSAVLPCSCKCLKYILLFGIANIKHWFLTLFISYPLKFISFCNNYFFIQYSFEALKEVSLSNVNAIMCLQTPLCSFDWRWNFTKPEDLFFQQRWGWFLLPRQHSVIWLLQWDLHIYVIEMNL